MMIQNVGLTITSHPLQTIKHDHHHQTHNVVAWQVKMSRPKWNYAQNLQPDGELRCGIHFFNERSEMMAAIQQHIMERCECDEVQAPHPCMVPKQQNPTHNGLHVIGTTSLVSLANGSVVGPRVVWVQIGHVLRGGRLTGEWLVSRLWRPGTSFPEYYGAGFGWSPTPAFFTRSAAIVALQEAMKAPRFADHAAY